MVAFNIKLMGENFLLQAHFIGNWYFLDDVGITIILNYAWTFYGMTILLHAQWIRILNIIFI